ncbi:putative Dynein light chain roadblock-type 2 [Hypsibius exemplaris]|uniref:Dynein light chain roadblock-type 2 n=1 Tax=Hypsibius exemplaris TaxID=2072580 RepID=A0A1W0X208_HYPEX|nr:putative Dynein light chain roadblock-type 2 [Hypsibius exemplaris]
MASAAKSNHSVHFDGDEADIGETLNRIKTHKGVVGIIVLTQDGVVLKSTLDDETASSYGLLVHDLVRRSRLGIRDFDPSNDLSFLRIRTKKHEIMVAPDRDYLLIVIQNPNSENGQYEPLRLRTRPETADDDGDKSAL